MNSPLSQKFTGRSRSSRLSSARISRQRRQHRVIAEVSSRRQLPGTRRQLSATDALSYLETVRKHLEHDLQAFRTFLDVLERFENGEMDVLDVTSHLTKVFRDNSNLLSGFRIFFPEGSNNTSSMGCPKQESDYMAVEPLNGSVPPRTQIRKISQLLCNSSSSNLTKIEADDESWRTDVGVDSFIRGASIKTERSSSSYGYDRDEYFRASRSVSTDYGYYYVRRAFSMEHEEDRGWRPSCSPAFVQ